MSFVLDQKWRALTCSLCTDVPFPSEKSGDPLPIFSEGEATSVHRLSPAVFSRLPSLSDSASPVDAPVN